MKRLRQMRRIDTGQQRNIRYCRAFKEDLQQVIDLMTVDGKPPELASGDFAFDDADDLFGFLGAGGKEEIRIRCNKPYVTVQTRADYLRVYTHDSSDSSLALLHRITEVLNKCSVYRPWRSPSVSALLGGGLPGFLLAFAYSHRTQASVALAATALAISTWFLVFRIVSLQKARANRFYGVSRGSRKSFWQRKGDDLLVALVGGIIGAVVGAGLGVAGTLYTQAHSTDAPQKSAANTSQPKP